MLQGTEARDLESARRCAQDVALDGRGLMPLGQARELVRKTEVAESGEEKLVGGFNVMDFDYLWLALLSLENAEEFCKEALRIEWKFSPRGRYNIAPFERYGDGVLPWLEGSILNDDTFPETPWCLLPILQKLLSLDPVPSRAFRLGLRVRAREGFSGPLKPVALSMLLEGHARGLALAVAECNEQQSGDILRDVFVQDPEGTWCALETVSARGLGSLCSNIVEELQQAAKEEDEKVEDEQLDGWVSSPRDPKSMPLTFAQLNSRFARSHGPSFDNCNVFYGGAYASAIVLPNGGGEILALQVIGGAFNGSRVCKELWTYTSIPGRPFASGIDFSTTLIHAGYMDETESSQFGQGFTLLMGLESRSLDCSHLPEHVVAQLEPEIAEKLSDPTHAKERAAIIIAQSPELSSKVLSGPLAIVLTLGVGEADAMETEVLFDRLQLHELPKTGEAVSQCKSIRQIVKALRERVKLQSIVNGPAPLSFLAEAYI